MKNFQYPIKKEIQFSNKRIILFDVPTGEKFNRNVFCLETNGTIVWQIEEQKINPGGAEDCPFVDINLNNGELVLHNWCSYRIMVEPLTGKILSKIEVR